MWILKMDAIKTLPKNDSPWKQILVKNRNLIGTMNKEKSIFFLRLFLYLNLTFLLTVPFIKPYRNPVYKFTGPQ